MRRIAAAVTAMKKTDRNRASPGQKAEGGAGVAHMDDVEEPVDDGKALMEPEVIVIQAFVS